jgi:hypothetical protein
VGCKIQNLQVLPEDSAKKDISFGDPAQSPDGKLVAVRSLHEGLAIRDPDASCALTATLSPDGRWLAAVVGARDAPVVAWDLNLPDTAEPARSLDAVCNLEESNCIRRLCDKISTALDERQLRSLSAMRPLTSLTARSEQPVVDASGRVLAAPIPAKAPAKSCRRASPDQPMRCRARSDLLSPYMRGK